MSRKNGPPRNRPTKGGPVAHFLRVIPASAFEWQETIEYFVTLAAVGGNLVARLAASLGGKSVA